MLVTLGLTRLASRKPLSATDFGYDTKPLSKKNIIIIASVFVVTHAAFILLSKIGGVTTNAKAEFLSTGFGKGFTSDLILIISVVIFAPVVEELVYRGVMLRAMHDGLLKFFPKSRSIIGIPALVAISFTAIAFILPHVSNLSVNVYTVSYFITSAGFSVVYLATRSMVAAMVSHSLQSCNAFGQLLVFGHGDVVVSPIIYGIAFLCPVIVYFIGVGIGHFFSRP